MAQETTPFCDYALKYFETGFNVLPLRECSKAPFINNWSVWCNTRQSASQVDLWATSFPKCNIGIPLGSISNIIALDFDIEGGEIYDDIIKLLPSMPVKKRGVRGFTAFFKYSGETARKWYKNGAVVMELLSTGNQTVVPPSIHPDTKQPYTWTTPETLLDARVSDLPTLPDNFISKVDKIMGYNTPHEQRQKGSVDSADMKEVVKALTFVPANEYATWLTIGMALHRDSISNFSIWDNWSRKAPNYEEKVMLKKWASFGEHSNPVTIGTIFHYAIGYGYHPPRDETPVFDFDITQTNIIINTNTEEYKEEEFTDYLLDAPGLPGEIATWINSTATKRQPILALGAAICASGTIFAHKIRNDSNLRTNFMVLGLAESGSGKNHARECVKALFQGVDLSHHVFGKFASDAALLNTLADAEGVGLALVDEIGREMKALNSYKAGGHELRLLTMMMEIYSEAGGIYEGKKYADIENCKRLIQPCLNVYGTSVPGRFYSAMSSDEAIDGFLARWLVFESNDIDPPLQLKGDLDNIPGSLQESIEYIRSLTRFKPVPPGSATLAPIPHPHIIQYSEGATDILQQLTIKCNELRIQEIKKDGMLAPIWARTREHAIKLALVAHSYGSGLIDIKAMKWACAMAMHLSHVAVTAINTHVANSSYEKNMNRIKILIQRAGEQGLTARKLSHSVRDIKQREIQEIIQHLSQSGNIDIIESVYNGRISYSYVAR